MIAVLALTLPVSIFVSLMMKIKIWPLPQNVSWNSILYFDTTISVTPIFFCHLISEHIHFSHPFIFLLNNFPDVKFLSTQTQNAGLFNRKNIYIGIAHEGSLYNNHLWPSSGVSVDHFECWLKDLNHNSFISITSEK